VDSPRDTRRPRRKGGKPSELADAPEDTHAEHELLDYDLDPEHWKLDAIDTSDVGFAFQHGTHSGHGKTRSTSEVLMVCASVIVTLSVGWLLYWKFSSSGTELKALKLTLLCCSFGACSWAMNVLNKTLVKDLKAPTLVTAAQMLMTVIGALILARDKLTGTKSQCIKWSFIPFIFFGMLVSSFFTYQYLTLSLLMVIRNLGPLITLPIESVVMPQDKRPYVTRMMVCALLVVLASTFLYCQKIQVSGQGFMLALLNMLLAITDRVAQRRLLTTECKDLSTETCMFLNNAVGLIPTLALALFLGEFSKVDVHVWFGSLTAVLLLLSGLIGTGICWFALAVQREITATSFMVLQNAVRMAVVLFGVLAFFDPIGWPFQVLGLVLSFAGAFWYGLAQLQGQAELKAANVAKMAEEENAKKASAAAADEDDIKKK
jgi:drug/metabolite transporter (DMT)-like permease